MKVTGWKRYNVDGRVIDIEFVEYDHLIGQRIKGWQYANEEQETWQRSYIVSFDDHTNYGILVNADNEGDALDVAVDFAEEMGWEGYFVDDNDEDEDEDEDYETAGSNGRRIRGDEVKIFEVETPPLPKRRVTYSGGRPVRNPVGHAYYARLIELAQQNSDFRRVVFTGKRSQIVLMSIPSGGSIGWEQHDRVEQMFVFVSGTGIGLVGGQQYTIEPGIGMVVPPGTRHNIVNTGDQPLQLFTIYAPPNHIDQRVHRTRADAYADRQDAAFGVAVKEKLRVENVRSSIEPMRTHHRRQHAREALSNEGMFSNPLALTENPILFENPLSGGAKAAIGIGVVAALSVGAYFLFFNKPAAAAPAAAPSTPPPGAAYSAANAQPAPLGMAGTSMTATVGSSLQAQSGGGTWKGSVTSSDPTVLAPSVPATPDGFVAIKAGTATLTGTYVSGLGQTVTASIAVTVS